MRRRCPNTLFIQHVAQRGRIRYDEGIIYGDLNDEDKKLWKKTASSAAGIGGSWAGAVVGAKAGAAGGAAFGTLICPGLGTVVGGFLGGIGAGIAGGRMERRSDELRLAGYYEIFQLLLSK